MATSSTLSVAPGVGCSLWSLHIECSPCPLMVDPTRGVGGCQCGPGVVARHCCWLVQDETGAWRAWQCVAKTPKTKPWQESKQGVRRDFCLGLVSAAIKVLKGWPSRCAGQDCAQSGRPAGQSGAVELFSSCPRLPAIHRGRICSFFWVRPRPAPSCPAVDSTEPCGTESTSAMMRPTPSPLPPRTPMSPCRACHASLNSPQPPSTTTTPAP